MDERPNILLIMADQLRWDYIGAYGKNSWINTPNIDSLAKEILMLIQLYYSAKHSSKNQAACIAPNTDRIKIQCCGSMA